MPTYEYVCEACEHEFDEFQSINDKPLKKCPKCGKPRLRRLFGIGAAVLFKGSGFYQTDYRSESYKTAAKAEQEPAKSSTTDTASPNDKAAKANTATGAKSTKKTSKTDS
jgi:putative FmdB family regulatory protein